MINSLKLISYLLRRNTIFIKSLTSAMGDNLLATSILPELRKKYPQHKIVVESRRWDELFHNNPHVDFVTNKHYKTTKRHLKLKYYIDNKTNLSIYRQLAKFVDYDGELFAQLYLTNEELLENKNLLKEKKINKPYIAICPEGKQNFSSNRKEWFFDRFQKVVIRLKNQFDFVQLGMNSDKLLKDVYDCRGLKIRQSAAVVQHSELFFGLEGGLMHLAKSVNVDSVIIYGGFILPKVSGYKNNINLYNKTDCSPCFNSQEPLSVCEDKKCMTEINVADAVAAIEKKLDIKKSL